MAIEFKATEAVYRLPTGEYVGTVERNGVPVTAIIQTLDEDYKLVAEWAAENNVVIIKGYPPKPSAEKTLEELKADKKQEIEKVTQEYIDVGAEVSGKHYPVTGIEAEHILRCAIETQLLPDETATYMVRTVDGEIVELGADELKNVISGVNATMSFALARKNQCLKAIDEAETAGDVNAVEFGVMDGGNAGGEA